MIHHNTKHEVITTTENNVTEYKILAYGETFDYIDDLSIELILYRRYLYGPTHDPYKAFAHLKNAHALAFPSDDRVWCDWDHDLFWEHCLGGNTMGYRIGYAGGGGVGKSRRCAKLGILLWLSAPKKHRILTTSVSLAAAQGRVWGYCSDLLKEVAKNWDWVRYLYGPRRQSVHWKGNKEDTRSGLYLSATLRGEEENTLSTLIGIHPDEYYLFLIDEANFMPLGLNTVFENSLTGSKGVQFILLANSRQKTDLHGISCQPKTGWHTIDFLKQHRWETANGVCLHVNPYQSPADVHPDPIVRAFYKSINFIDLEKINEKKKLLGEHSPQFYSQVLGLWFEGDAQSTVLSEQLLKSNLAYIPPVWSTIPRTMIAACDPAFSVGGDECIIYFGEVGYDETGKFILDVVEKVLIGRVVSDEDPYYQVSRGIIQACEQRNVPSYLFGLDVHGNASGLAAILSRDWATNDFLRIDGSASPSDEYVELSNKPANKTYDNKVTECWMRIKRLVMHRQLRRLPLDAAQQFCFRQIQISKNGLMGLEDKKGFKTRIIKIPGLTFRSPDEADGIANLGEVAYLRFNLKPESDLEATKRLKEWELQPFILAEQQKQQQILAMLDKTSKMQRMQIAQRPERDYSKMKSSYGIQQTSKKSYREST